MPTKTEPFTATTINLGRCTLQSEITEVDREQISELLALMDPWRILGYSSSGLNTYLSRDDPALKRFGICINSATIGVICIRYPWLRGPYIELLGIDPTHQGKGIGKEIIEWIEQQTAPHAMNIWVASSSFNKKALMFYNGLGFNEVSLLDNLVSVGKSEVLLRKELSNNR